MQWNNQKGDMEMRGKRWIAWMMGLICLLPAVAAAQVEVRGYERGNGYQYVLYGRYPYEKDGGEQELLWRVLTVEDNRAFLMTEYVIDYVQYHPQKDKDPDCPLDYKDSAICHYLNTTCIDRMLTEEQRQPLFEMENGRGLLSLATTEELQNPQTGFSRAKYTVDKRRQAVGTPYAYQLGLRRIDRSGHVWYFTADWRRLGFRWIVGDNGHISCVGTDRFGGVRPVMYVDVTQVDCVEGAGTLEDPFRWQPVQAAAD